MNKKIKRNNNRYWRWTKGSRGWAIIASDNKKIQTKSYYQQGWTKGLGGVTSTTKDEQGGEVATTEKYERRITRTWKRLPTESNKSGTTITLGGLCQLRSNNNNIRRVVPIEE